MAPPAPRRAGQDYASRHAPSRRDIPAVVNPVRAGSANRAPEHEPVWHANHVGAGLGLEPEFFIERHVHVLVRLKVGDATLRIDPGAKLPEQRAADAPALQIALLLAATGPAWWAMASARHPQGKQGDRRG